MHRAAAADHEGQATLNKGMGNKSIVAAHTDLAAAHTDMAQKHTDLASKQLKAKPGTAQNLGEGFGVRTMDPEVLYRSADYDMQKKQSYDAPRQKHGQSATVADLQRIANGVFAKTSAP